MQAFFSYQTADRRTAGEVRKFVADLNIDTFMAHEDIEVSHEWQLTILDALARSDIFIAILSKNYLSSAFCMQEAGIAVQRKMTIIPLSVDGTVSPGFMGFIQSKKLDPENIDTNLVLTGIARFDRSFVRNVLIERFGRSRSYRGAEANFDLLRHYLADASEDELKLILQAAAKNDQILHASQLVSRHLPQLFEMHGHLLEEGEREEIRRTLDRYADARK